MLHNCSNSLKIIGICILWNEYSCKLIHSNTQQVYINPLKLLGIDLFEIILIFRWIFFIMIRFISSIIKCMFCALFSPFWSWFSSFTSSSSESEIFITWSFAECSDSSWLSSEFSESAELFCWLCPIFGNIGFCVRLILSQMVFIFCIALLWLSMDSLWFCQICLSIQSIVSWSFLMLSEFL